jgi:hypothetical protein
MHRFARDTEFDEADLSELRARLRRMTAVELQRFEAAAKYMCSPEANYGTPSQEFRIQLREANAEYRRRLKKSACKGE